MEPKLCPEPVRGPAPRPRLPHGLQSQAVRSKEPKLSDVMDTTEAIIPNLRTGQVVSLKSTTWSPIPIDGADGTAAGQGRPQ